MLSAWTCSACTLPSTAGGAKRMTYESAVRSDFLKRDVQIGVAREHDVASARSDSEVADGFIEIRILEPRSPRRARHVDRRSPLDPAPFFGERGPLAEIRRIFDRHRAVTSPGSIGHHHKYSRALAGRYGGHAHSASLIGESLGLVFVRKFHSREIES
jgi:hypothetical protein